MAKYSYELKKEIVIAYLRGEGGYGYLANKYEIKSFGNVAKWVKSYQAFGDEGLMRSRKNKSYTSEFKISVVELYPVFDSSNKEKTARPLVFQGLQPFFKLYRYVLVSCFFKLFCFFNNGSHRSFGYDFVVCTKTERLM